MGLGVLKAFEAANRPLPVMTGDPVVGYFKQWATLKDKGFKTFVQTNPPGIVASGLKIAVRLAIGQKMKPLTDNTYYYPPSLTVDNSNFDQVYATLQGKPDTYFLDEYLTDAKADALFQ
jgi:ribose transport system substrate-binding protein